MRKIDRTVYEETKFIAVVGVILSLIMESIFLIMRKWDYTVLLGNLLGLMIAVLNFLFMGIGIQNALAKDEKEAKTAMQVSHSVRTLLQFVIIVAGIVLPYFNSIATVIALFFPRIAIAFRPLIKRHDEGSEMFDKAQQP